MMKGLLFVLLFFVFSFAAKAQKQFNNGLALSVGTEYLPENDEHLNSDLTFTSNPNFGLILGYERKLGTKVAIKITTAYYAARTSKEITIETNPEEQSIGKLSSQIKRFEGSLGFCYWLITKQKYYFTPGIALHYGQTFQVKVNAEDNQGNPLLPEQTESVSNNYVNASLALTNRFELTRFRSERKGTFGALFFVVSPYFAYNIKKIEVAEWTNPKANIFGGGFQVGLQVAF